MRIWPSSRIPPRGDDASRFTGCTVGIDPALNRGLVNLVSPLCLVALRRDSVLFASLLLPPLPLGHLLARLALSLLVFAGLLFAQPLLMGFLIAHSLFARKSLLRFTRLPLSLLQFTGLLVAELLFPCSLLARLLLACLLFPCLLFPCLLLPGLLFSDRLLTARLVRATLLFTPGFLAAHLLLPLLLFSPLLLFATSLLLLPSLLLLLLLLLPLPFLFFSFLSLALLFLLVIVPFVLLGRIGGMSGISALRMRGQGHGAGKRDCEGSGHHPSHESGTV